jgi:threonine/homoserine/homoserine lactone efflux protein
MTPAFLGIQYGLLLATLVGPLLFLLIQSCLERGIKGGLTVGVGIWLSDFVYIASVLFWFEELIWIVNQHLFKSILGIFGGILLMAIGFLQIRNAENTKLSYSSKSILIDGFQGFLVNTVNPFTMIFWVLIMSNVIAPNAYDVTQSIYFFAGILGTIIATDTCKVLLAERIQRYVIGNIRKVRVVNGSVFILFGIILIFRIFL